MPIAANAMPAELRDVDLGAEGIAGLYVQFIGQLGRAIGDGIILAGAWLYLRSLPPGIDYPLTATISAAMLVKLALLAWLLTILWRFARALLSGVRWLRLESRGMQWAGPSGERLRVIFYRGSDQILRCDQTSRAQRLADDSAGRRYRRSALVRDGAVLAALAVLYHYMPLAFSHLRDVLSTSLRADYDRWDVSVLVRLVFLLLVIVPRAVDLLMIALESIVHASGAQFMPGAKVRDS